MILADAAIWIDHFRIHDPDMTARLLEERILLHPFVFGEVALGRWRGRSEALSIMAPLPAPTIADHGDVLALIETQQLFGRGVGWIDCHLLASTRLTPGARLWTRDKRLHTAATDLGIAHGHGTH